MKGHQLYQMAIAKAQLDQALDKALCTAVECVTNNLPLCEADELNIAGSIQAARAALDRFEEATRGKRSAHA